MDHKTELVATKAGASTLPASTRVAIIGGGAVGASILYHLAERGWNDAVLIERDELTSGSTWHAAGNCPTFSPNWAIMNMQRYSAAQYRELGERVDYPINYHVTGSIRLAHSRERMQEFRRAIGMAERQGMNLALIDLAETRRRHPFVELHDLEGAMYDPCDGDIDPAQLTQAFAKGARDKGAQVVRHCRVMSVARCGDDWDLETTGGHVRCEHVVNAAGFRAGEVSRMFIRHGGREAPMAVMGHQYLLTEPIAEIEAWSRDEGRKLPLLRDVDSSYYLRQEAYGLNLGPYERSCKAYWLDGQPDDFSFQLFTDDLDRIEWQIEDAARRVPLLGTAGISKIINGPIPYAPDGMPLIGPMPGVRNAYEACVFTFGIAQAGGAGKVLSEWIIDGAPEWDMWSCDPRRFTAFADADYCVAKAMESYGHEYAMHFPRQSWPAGRDRKLSPVHRQLLELGGQMNPSNGWERADWFAAKGDDISPKRRHSWLRDGPWERRIRQECEAVRDHVGVLDLVGFSRFDIAGPGAACWLLGLIAGRLPPVGRMCLAYFPDRRGRVLAEMSVIRHDEEIFTLITAAAAQWHDLDLLRAALPDDHEFSIQDRSDAVTTFLVTGPQSRSLLAPLVDADLAAPWLSHQRATLHNHRMHLVRVSFAGELGWELHLSREDAGPVFDTLLAGGARPFGMAALDSLRLEKAYRHWKTDLSTDYTLLECRLDRFVDFDKPEPFPGRQALLDERHRGCTKKMAMLAIDCDLHDAPYMANVRQDGEIVGEVTSSAWGYRVEMGLAMSMLKSDIVTGDGALEVDIYGDRFGARILPPHAVWDPDNLRIRAQD